MNDVRSRRCAFALCATGERYVMYRNNLARSLKAYVPDADIVDIDLSEAAKLLEDVQEKSVSMFARLAIPLMPVFRQYDRVVWLDADTDVVSEEFADILNVETSDDGLAAAPDINQSDFARRMAARFPGYRKPEYYNSGVLVMDMRKIDLARWRRRVCAGIVEHLRYRFKWPDQDLLNAYFDIKGMDPRFNWIWRRGECPSCGGACLVHYCDPVGHQKLDELISERNPVMPSGRWQERCVVTSLRHDFIKPWIRAYFASGNTLPLVIIPNPPDNWVPGDMEYCRAAAEATGGMVFDCSKEWAAAKDLASRAVKQRPGWFTKKLLLHAAATRIAPKSWAWIDDDAEVTGNLDECFDYAERAPGFICTQFYCPNEIGNRHPERMYRSKIDPADKLCWNSLMFFHGEANRYLARDLGRDFPIEDDEIVFCDLYKSDPDWHEGFCDFSLRFWQVSCKRKRDIPALWRGKLIHYTSMVAGGEVKRMWAEKADKLPPAPFESGAPLQQNDVRYDAGDSSVDAVFVVGKGSSNDNEELRYALRSLAKNCGFVRNVYICGECPSWVDKSIVKHLQWPDRFTHAKDANIIDKLRHACEARGIAKRILFCSDDQFQTKECTWDDFRPRYLRRYDPADRWYEERHRVWHARLRKTLEREVQRRRELGMEHRDVFYYQPHIWMPIDRDRFIEYAKWCDYEHRDDTIIASGYYNFVDANGVQDFDHAFLWSNAKSATGARHIAYNDGSFDAAAGIMRKLFPEKCRFEM